MKYYKIALPVSASSGEYIYPDKYNLFSRYIVDHLYYKDDTEDKTYLLVQTKDDAAGVLDGASAVTEIDLVTAKEISTNNEEVKEIITDEAKVKRLAIKASLGEVLTADETKAIDPEDDTVAGFGKSKTFADRAQATEDALK